MSRDSGQLASAVPSAPTATGRPDHVLVPVMLAASMLPTASTIDCPVAPHTWATKSVAISLVRAGETAATRADVAVRKLTIRIIHYAVLPLSPRGRGQGEGREAGTIKGERKDDRRPSSGSTTISRRARGSAAPRRTTRPLLPLRGREWSCRLASFEDLVRAAQQRWRNREADGMSRSYVDHQFERRRLLDRKVGRPSTLENLVDVQARVPEVSCEARSIAQQASGLGKFPVGVHRRPALPDRERGETLSLVREQWIRHQDEGAGFLLTE